jgi:dATP pyrophosphohydrolase
MPKVVSDIVDVYVVRRLNARVQFLLLQRAHDVAMPMTWQGFHTQIEDGEPTLAAAVRAVHSYCGLNVSAAFSSDYVNQFFDETRDVLVLAPVIAVNVHPQAPVNLSDDYRDIAWLGEHEATARLMFAGQRTAVHRIAEVLGIGEAESEVYRLDVSAYRAETLDQDDAEEHDLKTSVVIPPADKADGL